MRISIIDCNSYGFGQRLAVSDVIGAGPRTIAGIFEAHDIETRIHTPDRINFKYIQRSDLIVFSGMISDFKIIKKLSKKFKNKKQICGGMISLEYERILAKTNIDCVVIGEGELTILELMENDFNFKALDQGIAFKDHGKIVAKEPRRLMTEAEMEKYTKPSTKRIKDYAHYYARRVYVEVLRGCSNTLPLLGKMGCGFCCVPNVFGAPRNRPEEAIVSEIKGLLEQGVKRIVLSAPDILDYKRSKPCMDPKKPWPNTKALKSLLRSVARLCQRYQAYFRIENIKPCLVNENVAKVLKEMPTPRLTGIGLESGHYKDLRLMNKPYGPREIEQAIINLNKENIRLNLYVIYGLRFQGTKSYRATLFFLKKLLSKVQNIEKITMSRFVPIPKSAFENLEPYSPKNKSLDRLLEFVRKKNLELNKKHYLGSKVELFPVLDLGKYSLCYPKTDGPYVLVPKTNKKLVTARIVEVRERTLYGKILDQRETI